MTKLERIVKWGAILLIGIALGYGYRMIQIANAFESPVKAGWALSKDDPVRLAMNRMGPLYDYKMVGETLYVDTGTGVWRRLRYDRH